MLSDSNGKTVSSENENVAMIEMVDGSKSTGDRHPPSSTLTARQGHPRGNSDTIQQENATASHNPAVVTSRAPKPKSIWRKFLSLGNFMGAAGGKDNSVLSFKAGAFGVFVDTVDSAVSSEKKEDIRASFNWRKFLPLSEENENDAVGRTVSTPTENATASSTNHRLLFGFNYDSSSTFRQRIWDAVRNGQYVWMFLFALGVVSACLSFLMDWAVLSILQLRSYVTTSSHDSGGFVPGLVVWLLFSLFCISASIYFTRLISPSAIGGGIAPMKAILSGTVIADYLTFRTLCSKVIGLVLAMSSGISIGKLGPFVHAASCIANLLCTKVPFFKRIGDVESLRLQMLSAGCAVGVSSTFGTPIAGVLFSIEVTATYYLVSNYWKAFWASLVGSYILLQLTGLRRGTEEMLSLFTTNMPNVPYNTFELFMFALVGIITGLLGALFVRIFQAWVYWRRSLKTEWDKLQPLSENPSNSEKYSYYCRKFYYGMFDGTPYNLGVGVTVITCLLTYPYTLGPYMARSDRTTINDVFQPELNANAGWTTAPQCFLPLFLYVAIKYLLTIVAITCPIPCGGFGPVFTIGAVMGRFIGEFFDYLTPTTFTVTSAGYAVVGAAAFAAGTTRTVASALIVFETTGEMRHIVPVLLSTLVAIGVGNMFSDSLFDAIMIIRKLPVLTAIRHKKNYEKTAADVMLPLCAVVPQSGSASMVLSALEECPIGTLVAIVNSSSDLTVIGCCHRTELLKLAEMAEESVNQANAEAELAASRLHDNDEYDESEDDSDDYESSDSEELVEPMPVSNSGDLVSLSPENPTSVTNSNNPFLDGDAQINTDNVVSVLPPQASQGAPRKFDSYRFMEGVMNAKNKDGRTMVTSPFIIMHQTELAQVFVYFHMLHLKEAFVTYGGKLVGRITKQSLIEGEY